MKDVVDVLKEVPALVVALQNSPLVVVAVFGLAALALAAFAIWKK